MLPSPSSLHTIWQFLSIDTDDACRLVLDGQDQGVVKPDQAKRISVNLGDHILKCTIEGIPDLTWRKVIEVKNSEQVEALISLKALHIQYEEAVAKLEKEKNPPTGPPASVSAQRKAEVPSETSSSPLGSGGSSGTATSAPATVVLLVESSSRYHGWLTSSERSWANILFSGLRQQDFVALISFNGGAHDPNRFYTE
jgi:hypothetical protein